MNFPDDFTHDPILGTPIPDELKPDRAFLERLTWYARWYGHDGDWIELVSFLQSLYYAAGIAPPLEKELEPFPLSQTATNDERDDSERDRC